ncbi:MAG TPA: prepilin peptidase [Candidatus Polarisedimenticolia bacterium]|jgi:leader peptidase (prepilin peptidase)/N-methyltransferase|nr:prepilin peptidase [Candidatus Polarisedimenticolia bacterium]
MPSFVLWFLVAGTGACIGSFLNVCIHRLPRRVSIVRPRSACPGCGRLIAWHDNIPVLSFLILGGRCRRCRAAIPLRYPLVEAATCLLFVLLFMKRGPTVGFAVQALFIAALTALIVIDALHQILPDAITLPGIALGLLTSPLRDGGSRAVVDALAGAALGFLLPWSINEAYRLWQALRGVPRDRREDGIGQGDFKLLAMIGAFLGIKLLLFTLFVGAVSGAIFGVLMMWRRGYGWKSKLPYGVFLGGAAILGVFVGDSWVRLYLDFAGVGR